MKKILISALFLTFAFQIANAQESCFENNSTELMLNQADSEIVISDTLKEKSRFGKERKIIKEEKQPESPIKVDVKALEKDYMLDYTTNQTNSLMILH